VDSLIVAYLLYAGVDLLGDAGRVEDLVELVETADAILRRSWGPYQGCIRVAALLLGQAATHADHPDADLRRRLQAVAERIADDADDILNGEPSRPQMKPGPDALAWAARIAAERLRLDAARGKAPEADALVDSWRECLRAHDALGHRAGAAYSARRLAEVLAQVGRTQDAATAIADARRRAEALGVSLPEPPASKERTTEDLTPREREILTEVARGLSNGQIGKRLYISPKTVSVHVSNVLAKLGAGSRGEAAAIARDRGLLD
jgi:DNA-binding CsgD family transcriptional regulator